MYLLTCVAMIKMKLCYSTSNHKILYLIMTIVCRKNLNQSNLMDCKIITIEREEKVFFCDEPRLLSIFLNSTKIRWIGLQYAKV
jgi:hypothetical protein